MESLLCNGSYNKWLCISMHAALKPDLTGDNWDLYSFNAYRSQKHVYIWHNTWPFQLPVKVDTEQDYGRII